MSKRSSKRKRQGKALPALGVAGVSLALASGASASTNEETTNVTSTSRSHEIFLGEEELSDVSLATFYVFDKENAGPPPPDQRIRVARCGGGCGGCGGCGGHGGCGCGGGGIHVACAGGGGCAGWHGGCGGCHVGCRVGCRACRCGGFFFRACVGCVACGGCGGCAGSCWIWTPTWGWVYSCWAGSEPTGQASPIPSEQVTQRAEASKTADVSTAGKGLK